MKVRRHRAEKPRRVASTPTRHSIRYDACESCNVALFNGRRVL
jgi:hypothetical protein